MIATQGEGHLCLPLWDHAIVCPYRNEGGHSYFFPHAGLSLIPPTATCRDTLTFFTRAGPQTLIMLQQLLTERPSQSFF